MPKQPETPKILEQLSKSNAAKSGVRTTRQQQNARRRFAIVALLFLPLLTIGLFLAYQQRLLRIELASLSEANQLLSITLASQNSQFQQLQQNLAELPQMVPIDDSAIRQLEENLNLEIERLDVLLADLQNQQFTAPVALNLEWKIFEAEYLLGIASQKLQLEADLAAAIALLESADAALLESGNNAVFAVRQAIAAELRQLRNVQVVDRAGIYLRLDNLAVQVDAITLLNSMRENYQNRRSTAAQPAQIGTNSTGFIDSTLTFLGSVFVWRKWEDTPEAMLAPGQDIHLKQNLLLMFEQTQLALLLRDGDLYRRSITNGSDWIHKYVVVDSAVAESILAELNSLRAIDIDPALPSIDQSLTLISQLTASER